MNFCRAQLRIQTVLLAVVLALIVPSASGNVFVKGPYLSKVGISDAQVIFDIGTRAANETEAPPKMRVKFGLKGTLDREVEAQRKSLLIAGQFIASLAELHPDSEYVYQIEGPDGTLSKPYHFTTAPDKPRPFSFLVFADTQKTGKEHVEVVATAVRYISDAPQKPSFLIHLGDHVRTGGEESQWNRYFANSRPLLAELCAWPVAGNHDYIGGVELFRAMFDLKDSTQYMFRHAGAWFVIVDTYRYDRQKQDWLANTLKSIPPGEGPIVVAMHDSVYSSGHRKPGHVKIREAVPPLFEKYGVDVVLSAHEHHYERMMPINGVTYIIAGSAGGPARKLAEDDKGGDLTAHIAAIENFMVFSVDGRKLSGKAIAVSGEVFDTIPEFDWSANDPKSEAL